MNLMSGAGLRLLHFFFLKRIIIRVVSLREQLFQTVRRLAGNILNGDALTDVGGVVRMALRGINLLVLFVLVLPTLVRMKIWEPISSAVTEIIRFGTPKKSALATPKPCREVHRPFTFL